jgi:nitrogen fixation protein FixH
MKIQAVPLALATIFGAVIAINLSMVYFAVGSAPGFVTDRPFERGKAYNFDLPAARAQEALGWTASIETRDALVTARFATRDAHPLEGLSVVAVASRVMGPVADIRQKLVETSPGTYTAALDLPKGQWDVELAATDGTGSFRLGKRVIAR